MTNQSPVVRNILKYIACLVVIFLAWYIGGARNYFVFEIGSAYAIANPPPPPPPAIGGSGGGSGSDQSGNACACFAGLDLATNKKLDEIATNYLKPIMENTQRTAANTSAIYSYYKNTITQQEQAGIDAMKTLGETILAQLQADKTQCDSYKEKFGAQQKGQKQVCRSFIENWKYAFADVGKNIRKDTYIELGRVAGLTPDRMQAIIDQLGLGQDTWYDTNRLDTLVPEQFGIKSGDGSVFFLQPNTTLAGAFLYGTYFNTQRLTRLAESQLQQRTDQAAEDLKNQALAGQGALSADEPVYDIIDATTGEVVGKRYSANTTELMMNESIRDAVSAGFQKAINSTFSPAVQSSIFPSFNEKTGLFEGGLLLLRGIGNSGTGGPGFFETGPTSGTIPVPATCFVNFTDLEKTVSVQDAANETATVVLVSKTKMKSIAFTADDDSVVSISPSSASPASGDEQTTPQYYSISIKGLKAGTARINARVSIKNTSKTCETNTPLTVTVQGACSISANPAAFVPTDASSLVWRDIDTVKEGFSIEMPGTITVTKNSDAGLSFDGVTLASANAFVASTTASFIPKSMFAIFDTFAQATTTVTIVGTGSTTVDMAATDPTSGDPLCAASVPAGVGTRCYVQSCETASAQTPPLHECVANQATTEFCDALTGALAPGDGTNAWCVGAVPAKYENVCATQ